ncbi:MAG: hypothetical protein E7348_04310 [Clostridiales bacterium]|nr:hypothetical protein [Clostridiales bacterium]
MQDDCLENYFYKNFNNDYGVVVMKVVNVMNFVREIDERHENSTERLLAFTTEQLRLVNEYNIDNTFLLQYDTLCDDRFMKLFQNEATEKTEFGIWYEIVEPLTTACGMPYTSENGWKWDWHINPGYSMVYTPEQRELLIDETMRKFYEIFGYYPRTVAGWVMDTHTFNHLAKNYDISAVAICRDQANTDAYTLLGGYFNQAYYPSINNIFTPAQSMQRQTKIPVFRLLGPCPIHNYDNNKYSSEKFKSLGRKSACFTLEPCWYMGSNEHTAKWMFDTYYGNESLGFSYAQIGQENSFLNCKDQVLSGMRMQIEQLLKREDVLFKKMGDTGELFSNMYKETTPPTSVVALDNFDSTDVQSVYYDCKNYTANLFRFEEKIFFRSLFLFDDRIEDLYLRESCTTFDAVYENLPIIDTMNCASEKRKQCGLMIDDNALSYTVEKLFSGVLKVKFGEKSVTFYEDRMEIVADRLLWYKDATRASTSLIENRLAFEYKGHKYYLIIEGADLIEENENFVFVRTDNKITLIPQRAE